MNVNYNIRIDERLRDDFKKIAQGNAHNPSALVRKFMQDYIKQNKGEVKMDKGHGTVEYKGMELAIDDMPEIDGTYESPYYSAIATDATGDEYKVKWEITHPDEKNLEDKSDACDWDVYEVEKL